MFANSLAYAAIVIFVIVFLLAFKRNYEVGMRVHNVPVTVALSFLVGVLWLVFGGA